MIDYLGCKIADFGKSRAFTEAGLKAGGADNGAPGIRAKYNKDYFAAFPLGPDGLNIAAVWVAPEG